VNELYIYQNARCNNKKISLRVLAVTQKKRSSVFLTQALCFNLYVGGINCSHREESCYNLQLSPRNKASGRAECNENRLREKD
jgi:hypothetical protein